MSVRLTEEKIARIRQAYERTNSISEAARLADVSWSCAKQIQAWARTGGAGRGRGGARSYA